MENEKELYIGVFYVLDLLDCLMQRSKNPAEINAYKAVEEVIMDTPWKEFIND